MTEEEKKALRRMAVRNEDPEVRRELDRIREERRAQRRYLMDTGGWS